MAPKRCQFGKFNIHGELNKVNHPWAFCSRDMETPPKDAQHGSHVFVAKLDVCNV